MVLPFALWALGALQTQRNPAEVLAEVDRALAAASPLSVSATLSRTQALTWESHLAEGTVVVDRARGAFRVDARVRELRGAEEREVTLAKEGARFFFLDHGARTFLEGDSPALGGLAGRMCLDLAQLTPSEPSYTAQAGAPALREPLTLAGVRCLALLAKVPDGPTAQTWYVGERDFLPRLWESARDLGEGDSLRKRCTVHSLQPHAPALPAFAVPEGYARGEPVAWSDPEARAARPDAGGFASLLDGIEPLRAQFNAEKGKVRALGLFAPT
jgi:hypothetical protein